MLKPTIFLALLIAGCGDGNQCASDTACVNGDGRTYRFCNTGNACYYQAGDGSRFQCASCGSCDDAEQLLTSWCMTGGGATTGATGGSTGSSFNCTSASCPLGGASYQFCSSPAATSCQYRTSDGMTFACNACADCSGAATQVSSWCAGASTTSTTGSTTSTTGSTTATTGSTTSGNTATTGSTTSTTGSTTSTTGSTTGGATDATCAATEPRSSCFVCCGDLHPDAYAAHLKHYDDCECPNCTTACTSATDVCHGGADFLGDCATCLKSFRAQCQGVGDAACSQDPACQPDLNCTGMCPVT